MIDASSPVFPNNIVSLLATRYSTAGVVDPETDPNLRVQVYKRALRPTDAIQSIGVVPTNWTPDEDSYEIRGLTSPGPSYPTLQQYWIMIQAFVKDGDETNGLAVHSVLSNRVRAMLYYDVPFRVGCAALAVDLGGATEHYRRHGVRQTVYVANDVQGSFLYLSTTQTFFETEIT